jgi:predicted nucleotide-binding protein
MSEWAEGNHVPSLMVTRAHAERQLNARIDKARDLLELPIRSEADLKRARREYDKWDSYTETLLRKLFDTPEISEEYLAPTRLFHHQSYTQRIDDYRHDVETKISRLEGLVDKLRLYEKPQSEPAPAKATALSRDIFIVHGHDEATKQSVARFIENLDLVAIILHEQPNRGRTLIEKLEQESSPAGYAVVLLTPDDVGARADKPKDLVPRPRQNVIFELGFFLGKLGRDRVCVLYRKGVERPSDISGVSYIEMLEGEGWLNHLAREMRAAGIEFDAGKLINR